MKAKIIGILLLTLLIATAISAVGNLNEKEIPENTGIVLNSSNNINIPQDTMSCNYGNIVIQRPWLPVSGWSAPFSDVNYGYITYDDFFDVTAPICDIHWWGFSVINIGGTWYPCDPTDITFNITFYTDNEGYPGDVVCSYVEVIPHSITPTGIYYEISAGGLFELFYFEYDLDPCCQLSNGWVSVLKTFSPNECIFAWIQSPDGNGKGLQYDIASWLWYNTADLAFILTDGEPAIPVLECDGEIRQTEVPPGTNVTGDFVVRNNGDAGSVLQWRIDNLSIPNWGSNWTITPSADFQTPDMSWLTVIVNFTAPEEKNTEFTGKIKVVNAIDSSKYCEIDVYIKTPRGRETYNTFFQRLFERFPNAFPILRQLLVVL
jgi:hypothetical protein